MCLLELPHAAIKRTLRHKAAANAAAASETALGRVCGIASKRTVTAHRGALSPVGHP